jgi:hypothetical protein
MKKIYLVLLVLLFGSCTRNEVCDCIETVNDYEYNEVTISEYKVEGCFEPYTQVTTYRWGTVVVDCR